MPIIISQERYKSQTKILLDKYAYLKDKFPEDEKLKKIGRVLRLLKTLYRRDKIYSVKQLNYLEKYQMFFAEERRALLVQGIELLQKLILHKKLNK